MNLYFAWTHGGSSKERRYVMTRYTLISVPHYGVLRVKKGVFFFALNLNKRLFN